MSNLLTASQVKKNSPAKEEFGEQSLCLVLDCIENWLCDCFGVEFLELLKDSIIDWTADTSYKGEFNDSENYIEADIVHFCGEYYKWESTDAYNEEEPGCSSDWVRLDKFDNDCLEKLWRNHLMKWLSYKVFKEALPHEHLKGGAFGLTIQKSDQVGGAAANEQWFDKYNRIISAQIAKRKRAMLDFVAYQSQNGCDYSCVSFLASACSVECQDSGTSNQHRVAW